MEQRVHHEVDALETPTGYIPKYEDLRKLFKEVLGKNYPKEDYIKQFTIRVPENLAKIERVSRFYQENVTDTPLELFGITLPATTTTCWKLKKNSATTSHRKNSKKRHLNFPLIWVKIFKWNYAY